MTRVLLIHAGLIPHYRIPIYGYLSEDLERHGFSLSVVSDGIQDGHADAIGFPYIRMRLKT